MYHILGVLQCKMETEWRNNNGFGDHMAFESPLSSSSSSPLKLFTVSSATVIESSCSPLSSESVGAAKYIEHSVSRYDTLAGVAIKYGVEVSDIKKINNLVSDLQMFALKTLYIPLPGRHPPSPVLTNGSDAQRLRTSEQTPMRRHSDIFESLQSLKLQSPKQKVSRAMYSSQEHYRLDSPDQNNGPEECEMAVYQKGGSDYSEDRTSDRRSSRYHLPSSIHRESNNVANGFKLKSGVLSNDASVPESDNWFSNLVKRRPKSETDFTSCATEKLLKEDVSSNGFSAIAGKGLALRLKTVAQNYVSTAVGDFSLAKSLNAVKRSSSVPSLQESDNSLSIWPTVNWSLKQDLQALSTAAISRPIFDGLPKPTSGRKNKTAVD